MRISTSTEQAVFVMLMLALQRGRTPLRSRLLAQRLNVSDSYLKKILKTMVDARLITARPGRVGGYVLARPIIDTTLGDVVAAIESMQPPTATRDLAAALFGDSDHVEDGVTAVQGAFAAAHEAYLAQLRALPLTALLVEEAWPDGLVDWNSHP